MKYKNISADKLQKLLDAHKAPIVLEYKENSIQNIRIALGDSHFKVAVGSYSVDVQIPEVETKWEVKAKLLDGIVGEKVFDDESEADEFISSLKEKYETVDNDIEVEKSEVSNCSDLRFLPNQVMKGIEG